MPFIELEILIPENTETGREISIAQLGEYGFEAFEEIPEGLRAFIPEKGFKSEIIDSLIVVRDIIYGKVSIESRVINDRNWNAEWEAGFRPVEIGNFCYIRSAFHPPSGLHKYDIVIDPKMSFGTGHHSTTELMIRMMSRLDFTGKSVLDMGCGTAILSIVASKMNAARVTGVDIDEWAYTNSRENLRSNNVTNCEIKLGDISAAGEHTYDIILANITRNILVRDMPRYSSLCRKNGMLLLSGFYTEDLDTIKSTASNFTFRYSDHIESKNWVSCLFIKE